MVWTHFWDMSSGGDQKLDFHHCFIEAPKSEAKTIFYNRFGRNPDRVTCTCCGSDYSISEYPTIDEATEYHRSSRAIFGPKTDLTVQEYEKSEGVKFIRADEIKPEERAGEVPEEGYVWR